ncbi:ATP-binding cassette domain-containing protein [bacterium]|nr:ATP-binding cassette domain-containing protein [bacterium]
MNIAENRVYPLKVRKIPRVEIGKRINKYLKLIEMKEFGTRTPAQLSGGQRQRVALTRALIFDPSLVLMDEPLGALDKKLREQMQFEILRLYKKLGVTVIYVTHDQSEALTMSDRIAVFDDGVVQQCAVPNKLYEDPENAFVADFIGENNFLHTTAAAQTMGLFVLKFQRVKRLTPNRATAALADASVLSSVRVKTLDVHELHFEAAPALQGARSPLRPTGFSVLRCESREFSA